MDITAYTNKFFEIEERLKLFEDNTNDFFWWDAVRFDVYYAIYYQITNATTNANKPIRVIPKAWSFIIRQFKFISLSIAIRIIKYDAIIFRAPRQVVAGKGHDAAIDHMIGLAPGKCLCIQTYPFSYHHSRIFSIEKKAARPKIIDKFLHNINQELNANISAETINHIVVSGIESFIQTKKSYARIFKQVNPRIIIMSQNGVQKSMFAAANELGIPLVEMQHGLINHGHPSYSYSTNIDYSNLNSFPNYFLTFSKYWIQSCHIPKAKCLPVGNDDFYIEQDRVSPLGDILFISADIYHSKLTPWVRFTAARLPNRIINYKLHPNQQGYFEKIKEEFSQVPNVNVIDGETPARELLANVSVAVVVQSTVAHEALQKGRRLCIIPMMDYEIHRDIFSLPEVHVTDTVDKLIQIVEQPVYVQQPPVFFERFNKQLATGLLNSFFEEKTIVECFKLNSDDSLKKPLDS